MFQILLSLPVFDTNIFIFYEQHHVKNVRKSPLDRKQRKCKIKHFYNTWPNPEYRDLLGQLTSQLTTCSARAPHTKVEKSYLSIQADISQQEQYVCVRADLFPIFLWAGKKGLQYESHRISMFNTHGISIFSQ